MFFRDYGANPLVLADMDSLSTFATDVDKGAYSIMRRYVEDGHLPPRDAPRVEEFVNYFSGGYPEFYNPDFRILMDGAPSPFGDGFYLVRIGVKGRVIDESRRKPAHLVFVVDTSGSMQAENRLGLVRESLHVLLGRLRPDDRVGIVAYGSNAWVVLESTTVQDRRIIEDAIDSLQPSGSTNAEEGLLLGYRMARRYFDSAANNRILLCSDGVANVGRTGPDSILERVKSEADHGIDLTTVGFGMGNFNDVLMERLADQGDGAYYYVDDLAEAHRVFEENLTGTLQTIARDAKLQVEFDPKIVQAYRLLGFENRDIADPDFRNDAVDAGEIGAGHEVTALYEVRFQKDVQPGRSGRFATVRMRYEVPDVEIPRPTGWALANAGEKQSQTRTLMSQEPEQRDRSRSVDAGGTESGERAFRTVPLVQEIEQPLRLDQLATDVSRTTPRFRLAAVVAELAEILRQSYWAKGQTIDEILPMTRDVARELQDDPDVVELLRLVERARSLEATMSPSERVDRDRIADGQRPVPPYFPPGRDDE
ncbi:MAG: von Willebrand factor type A domain-containing protein [Candidatus Eisenbacteria bacterium]|uniref:von Willebrand factor type A domain-containing protein n=1 Tax=Eiseniibacteriota bacterium TaxID=2212470 RepID=A0A956RPT2_UNCEI|nr:von Willebrand factor type A domain-containing protein [Candidatus Eisenbacteria bacterium]